jgi:hypothetical protein
MLMNFLKKLFRRKKTTNGLIGYWGVVDIESNTSQVLGEMYSYNNKWIPGPNLTEE